jgi:hypothetical protein
MFIDLLPPRHSLLELPSSFLGQLFHGSLSHGLRCLSPAVDELAQELLELAWFDFYLHGSISFLRGDVVRNWLRSLPDAKSGLLFVALSFTIVI